MHRENELELRLAESRHTEAELRRVIDILLSEGDAVFRSRSWRLGRALVGLAARLLGRRLPDAQDGAHWHRIAAAHDDALARRRVLLERLCVDAGQVEDLDAVLADLWRDVAAERAVTPP